MTAHLTLQRPLEDYVVFFENLTHRSLPLLGKYVAPDVRFIDPFNTLTGADRMAAVFEKMFEDTERAKFRVIDTAWGRSGHVAYLRWTMHAVPKGRKNEIVIEGMSEITFSPDGKVTSHIDHWDSGSQILARVPLLQWVWVLVRGRLSIKD
jgi:hypothetical protein